MVLEWFICQLKSHALATRLKQQLKQQPTFDGQLQPPFGPSGPPECSWLDPKAEAVGQQLCQVAKEVLELVSHVNDVLIEEPPLQAGST
ncbi:hypothetical protein OOU_Y34scaffold00445g20 [Pyricularia oryzae Y34]|uniref:Uncharacterized protein n=2 Tax=Pyricularia oryzae TaxID=318829 RepID=A0AA97P1U6_PYRO3|nr:hypothetical protein OOU_Y34scaffold00445g20 [Pyricularia oryzae Y34]